MNIQPQSVQLACEARTLSISTDTIARKPSAAVLDLADAVTTDAQ